MDVCRACMCTAGSTTTSLQSIFVHNIPDLFYALTRVRIKRNDGLPSVICSSCLNALNDCNSFKIKCLETDGQLRKKLPEIKIKNKNKINEDRDDNGGNNKHLYNVYSNKKKQPLSSAITPKEEEEEADPESDPEPDQGKSNTNINPLSKVNITEHEYDEQHETTAEDYHEPEIKIECDIELLKVEQIDYDYMFDNNSRDNLVENHTSTKKQSSSSEQSIIINSNDNNHPDEDDEDSDSSINLKVNTKKQIKKPIVNKPLSKYYISKHLLKKSEPYSKNKQSHRYKCGICNRGFMYQERYEGHLREHEGKKAAVCEFCGSEYTGWSYLRIHMEREHKDDIKYKCHCGKAFAYESGLIAHKVTHKRPSYICEECGKSFYDTYQLNQHSLTHKTETPFECDQCGKKFKAEDRLRNHQFRHKNIRDFKCNTCEKAFITGSELRVHFRSHSDVFNFDCKICGKRFRHKSQVNVHMRTHNIEFTYP